MLSILSVPTGSFDAIMATTGTLFTDLWLLIVIAIGIPIAFYVFRKVVSMVKGGAR